MGGNLDDLDLKALLSFLKDILFPGKPESQPVLQEADKIQTLFVTITEKTEISIPITITRVSEQVMALRPNAVSYYELADTILQSMPKEYSWPSKVVITIAAFAVIYAEFLLVRHLKTESPLAQRIALLKNKPNPETDSSNVEIMLSDLLDSMMTLTQWLVKIDDLPRSDAPYIKEDSNEMKDARDLFPNASRWIIISNGVSASAFVSSEIAVEVWEIAHLRYKLSKHLERLKERFEICERLIERNKAEESYENFRILMNTHHIKSKVLEAMIRRPKEDEKPLYNGTRKTKENLEVLKRKHVLLLISNLDAPHKELNAIKKHYNRRAPEHEYEVLWLPIVDSENSADEKFHDLRDKNINMPWYSVDHPSLIEPAAIRYIRQVWNFVHRPMLVALDPCGKINNLDVAPMMWIWGNLAFPFSKQWELSLWSTTRRNMSILVDDIDPRLVQWICEDEVICLYGGEDIDWIRRFNSLLPFIAQILRVPVKMFYVGKSNPTEKLKMCIEVVKEEYQGACFPLTNDECWYFWARLRSMRNSKKRLTGNANEDNLTKALTDILNFDDTGKGWAVFAQGQRDEDMAMASDDTMIRVLANIWYEDVQVDSPHEFVHTLHSEISNSVPTRQQPDMRCSCCVE